MSRFSIDTRSAPVSMQNTCGSTILPTCFFFTLPKKNNPKNDFVLEQKIQTVTLKLRGCQKCVCIAALSHFVLF